MPIKQQEARAALLKKGFRQDDRDHLFLFFY